MATIDSVDDAGSIEEGNDDKQEQNYTILELDDTTDNNNDVSNPPSKFPSLTNRLTKCRIFFILLSIVLFITSCVFVLLKLNQKPNEGKPKEQVPVPSDPPTNSPIPISKPRFSKEFFGNEDGDKYGHAISLGGMRLAVASEQYVQTHEYNYDVEGFEEKPQIDLTSLGDFSSSNSKHGMCLSGDGNRLAVGFTNNHTVFILDYHADKQNWTSLLEATPVSNEAGIEGDMFGEAVAFSQDGTYLAVGAPNHSDGMGRVYVYKEETESTGNDTMSWSLLGEPIDGNVTDEKFGHAVSISASGNTIAIAGSRVYVFAYENEEWSERWDGLDVGGNVSSADDEESKHYSISLSSDGKYLAVGDPFANGEGNGSKRGCASVYGFDDNVWSSYGKVEGAKDDYMAGFSVALSSDAKFMVVGTPGQESVAEFPGNAMVYEIMDKNLTQIQVLDGTLPGDSAGYSVAITADGIIAVGAPGLGNDGRGYVHTYPLVA